MRDYVAILCAGGHVSCFNAAIYGITENAKKNDIEIIGFKDGFKGAHSGKYYELNDKVMEKYENRGGSIIGSSREKSDSKEVKSTLERFSSAGINIMGIIGMCGDDHQKQLYSLYEKEGIPVVGWPKTMDNDLSVTEFTLGYPTTAMNAAKAIRQGFDGAWTNNRIHVITMFGRDTDWVVAAAGAWGRADLVIGGEVKGYNIKEIYEKALNKIDKNKKEYGRKFTVIAVAEGASIQGIESHIDSSNVDKHGNPKLVPEKLALEIQNGFKKIDEKASVSTDTLTYNDFRNCPPIEIDKKLAYYAGKRCLDELLKGNSGICVTINRFQKFNEDEFGTAPIPEVAQKRFLSKEGFIDYENMKVNESFIEYYKPLFGEAKTKEEILFKKLEEKCI